MKTSEAEPDGELLGDVMVVSGQGDDQHISCVECGHMYGPASEDPKLGAVMAERRMDELSSLNSSGMIDRIVIREFYCPGCGLMMAVNIQETGDPIRAELILGK